MLLKNPKQIMQKTKSIKPIKRSPISVLKEILYEGTIVVLQIIKKIYEENELCSAIFH